MSAIHRIGPADPYADDYPLDSATFFKLARRLFAYRGVMRSHAEEEGRRNAPRNSTSAQEVQHVPMSDPSVAGYFEVD